MDEQKICKEIMRFTGLDNETVTTQMLPYLRSLKARADLEDHLKGLIGLGKEQDKFVIDYLEARFPAKKQSPSSKLLEKNFPSLNPSNQPSRNNSPIFSTSTSNSSSSSLLKTNSNSNLYPNKSWDKSNQSLNNLQNQKQKQQQDHIKSIDHSGHFGLSGSVYIKDRGNESDKVENFYGGKKNKTQTQNQPKPTNPTLTKNLDGDPKKDLTSKSAVNKAAEKTEPVPKEKDLLENPVVSKTRISKTALRDISQLNKILEFFNNSNNNKKKKSKDQDVCFCGCTIHLPLKNPLPTQCEACGLILCRLNRPTNPCPSCNEESKLVKNLNLFENLYNYFKVQRDDLVKLELEKLERILKREREDRELIEAGKGEFPTLPNSSNNSNNKNQGLSSNLTNLTEDDKNNYSIKLTGGRSIESRIKEGYENLNTKKKSSSHTVIRIDSNNGKKKVISTTSTTFKKNLNPRLNENGKESGRDMINLIEFIGDEDENRSGNDGDRKDGQKIDGLCFVDELDDGYRKLKLSEQPLISYGFSDEKLRTRYQIRSSYLDQSSIGYVSSDIYDTEH